jgi:endonuclease/exonuclease/phosphatase family metal-dependent hydrolase
VRFLTYNIRHAEGYDGWVSNARIARVIRDAHADVVGLNEVWRLGGLFPQAEEIARLVGGEHVYQGNGRYAVLQQGNAILTTGTLTHTQDIRLPGGLEPRGALLADIEVAGESVCFATTHLSLGRAARARQIAALVEELPRDRPLVLTGDFNCKVEELEPLREFLQLPAERPATFPALKPRQEIDHIAYSRHWRLVEITAIRSLASDHLPMLAELALEP